MSDLPKVLETVAESAESEWRESKPDGFRGSHSLSYHIAFAVWEHLMETGSEIRFDREAALERFRQIPMQHLENASFETFYLNGALKQHEADCAMVGAFLEGSAEWEDEARIAKARIKKLEADLQAEAEHQAGASL